MTEHTGQPQFLCITCGKAFKYQYQWSRHSSRSGHQSVARADVLSLSDDRVTKVDRGAPSLEPRGEISDTITLAQTDDTTGAEYSELNDRLQDSAPTV
jgi:hypothetical protein